MLADVRRRTMKVKSKTLLLPLTIFVCCGIWPFLLLSIRDPIPTLPPPLSRLLRNTPPVNYEAPENPPEWKRPLTLTAHTTVTNGTAKLVLFTTGVDKAEFGGSFKVIGCLVGNTSVPTISFRSGMATCLVQEYSLKPGVPITVVIEHDEALTKAMQAESLNIGGERYKLEDGDVVPMPVTPEVLREKAEKVAAIRTLVKWHDDYIDKSTGLKHELCVMTAMRQYPYLLKDWIAFLRRIGVDKVYIYENWAIEDLNKLVGSDFVEVVRWPWVRSQMQSNNHFLLASSTRCKYVAFFDADEFPMIGGPTEDNMLKKYIKLRRAEGYSQVIFHFVMMLNDGYVRRPRGPLPTLYKRREKDQKVKLGKAVIETDMNWGVHKIHMIEQRGARGNLYWNTTMELNPITIKHNAMLIHYTKRSWEEFVVKNRVGGASVLTTGRPKRELDSNKPDAEYMDESNTVPFAEFGERWKKIMKLNDNGMMTLVSTVQGRSCHRTLCPGCWFVRVGKQECEPSNR